MREACLLLLLAAAPASAREGLRDFCADRPGLGTPACTLDPGHVQLELGFADWTLERSPDGRTDTVLVADTLVRIGIARHSEVQFGWTPYGHVRERDRAGGGVRSVGGTGDVFVALRRNLVHPDGTGTTLALMPYATLPTGGRAIGAGDWSAGLEVPFGFELARNLSFALTPRVEAAVDADGNGRHLAFGSVAGVELALAESLDASVELAATRDDDPAGHATEELAALSLGWRARRDLQLDAGANFGLNHASPDFELYAGISRRF